MTPGWLDGGVSKTSNNGESTFFPSSMTPQDVIDAINQAYNDKAYNNKAPIRGNEYTGMSNSGLEIRMYLNTNGKIISAFPAITR